MPCWYQECSGKKGKYIIPDELADKAWAKEGAPV